MKREAFEKEGHASLNQKWGWERRGGAGKRGESGVRTFSLLSSGERGVAGTCRKVSALPKGLTASDRRTEWTAQSPFRRRPSDSIRENSEKTDRGPSSKASQEKKKYTLGPLVGKTGGNKESTSENRQICVQDVISLGGTDE